MIAIYQSLSGDQADLISLVLTAAAIEHRVVKSWSGWMIAVLPADAAAAMIAVEAYRQENPDTAAPGSAAIDHGTRQTSW